MQMRKLVLLLSLACSLTLSQATWALDAPPNTGDGWATATPDVAGLNENLLEQLLAHVRSIGGDGVDGVAIAKGGQLVFEMYFPGFAYSANGIVDFDRDTLHDLQSVTKSITSVLVGIAIDGGFIPSVDVPLFDLFPNHAHLLDDEKATITLEHALTMTAGFEWNEETVYWSHPTSDHRKMSLATDFTGYLLAKPVRDEPGSRHYYNSGLPMSLLVAIHEATGRFADAFAEEYIFGPLGIVDYDWFKLAGNEPHGGGGLHLRPRDLLKIGQVMLSGGLWNGEQVLSTDWIDASTQLQIDTPATHWDGYGYFWWMRTYTANGGTYNAYEALGHGGQSLTIIPELDLVIAVLRSNYETHSSFSTNAMLEEYILPAAMGED